MHKEIYNMATELLEKEIDVEPTYKNIASVTINRDVVTLVMLSKKYNLDLLSLVALYEIFDKDVFLFFCILGDKSDGSLIGKNLDELEFGDSLGEFPKESTLKLMFSKSKKVSDALRRHNAKGLTSAMMPWYELLEKYVYTDSSGNKCLNFFHVKNDEELQPKKGKKKNG